MVVLIVMLVLSIAGLALGVVVTNTTSSLAGSRDTAQSRAAADAGIAAIVAHAQRTGDICDLTVTPDPPITEPNFEVTSTCASDRVIFESTGFGPGGSETTTQATYAYTAGGTGSGADMIFFSNVTFSHEVLTHTLTEDLLSIVVPSGGFTCMAPVFANLIVSGDFKSTGGCTVEGSVVAGGQFGMSNATDTVKGNVSSAGTSVNAINGSVLGDLHTAGGVTFGWSGKQVGGKATTGGATRLGNVTIQGDLTVPSGTNVLTTQSGTVVGITDRPGSVTPPDKPTFDSWFDYKFQLSDWQPYAGKHYQVQTLVNSGNGPGTCNYFSRNDPANENAKGWRDLGNLTTPTILDARACTSLTSNNGSQPTVTVQTNLVLLAKSFDMTKLTFNAAAGVDPRIWFIVEDTTANGIPSCNNGAGNIKVNGTVVAPPIVAMAYTPCIVDVDGIVNDTWSGSFYGGGFDYGGGLDFFGGAIVLPGMPESTYTTPGGPGAGTPTLGALISQYDVP